MKVLGSTHSVVNNKDYAQEYRKSKEVLGGAGDLSRDTILVMRRVNFDQNGKPKTEEDAKNHAWNKQWLKAIDEDDFELREKMLAEEIPNRFWIKDLPQPSKELLALHKKVKDKKLPAGWSKTPEGREAHPSLEKYLQDNPEINQRLYMTYSFMGMTGATLPRSIISTTTARSMTIREKNISRKRPEHLTKRRKLRPASISLSV